jgi:glycerol kinase
MKWFLRRQGGLPSSVQNASAACGTVRAWLLLQLVKEFVFADQSLNLLALFFEVAGETLERVVVPFLPCFEV